ncbi:hypothetical protein [Occallatibacter savannae]|uniref:hypothetical protein n=1 Tax=Occallatibacter savannae TaxID=1002691 RepID=UPI0013A59F30|nr:hypothetical protein [Occallatibacter savannae]
MLRNTLLACATVLAAGVVVSPLPAIAQTTHVAYVYVSNLVSPNTSTKHDLYAYGARADGSLYRVTGAPFNYDINDLWDNSHYLFGLSGTQIDSYWISSTGAPQLVGTVDAASHASNFCGGIGPLKVDHSGRNLYNPIADGDCMGFSLQTYAIGSTTGKLTYKATSDEVFLGGQELDFLGNNLFAYSPVCTGFDHESVGFISDFSRASDGTLHVIHSSNAAITPKNSSDEYCPLTIATDPTNHLAVLEQELDIFGDPYGPPAIATYSATTTGNLTTTSTYSNMPHTRSGARVMRMDPSGKLLAVAGSNGLDIFHYHGANPVTFAKTLLTGVPVDALYWDHSNHLYAVTRSNIGKGKLYVFTVTTSGVSQAPGSPHSIPNADSLIVRATN